MDIFKNMRIRGNVTLFPYMELLSLKITSHFPWFARTFPGHAFIFFFCKLSTPW
jgi:hypothetical protein